MDEVEYDVERARKDKGEEEAESREISIALCAVSSPVSAWTNSLHAVTTY